MKLNRTIRFVALSAALAGMLMLAGCKKNQGMIDHVVVKPNDSLDSVRVSLVFKDSVQTNLSGSIMMKDYGTLFLVPYAPSQPFEIGFDLDTSILHDQDYVQLTPVETLPNGIPMGLGYPLVEVKGSQPISPKFDLYGYVDVMKLQWLGVAAMFADLDQQNFPAGLSITQAFNPDTQGRAAILASVFGPTLNNDGSMQRPGGIALFANIRALLEKSKPGKSHVYKPRGEVKLDGSAAADYDDAKQLYQLQHQLIRTLNGM